MNLCVLKTFFVTFKLVFCAPFVQVGIGFQVVFNGSTISVGGTSASTPSFAAMLSLITGLVRILFSRLQTISIHNNNSRAIGSIKETTWIHQSAVVHGETGLLFRRDGRQQRSHERAQRHVRRLQLRAWLGPDDWIGNADLLETV